MTSGCQDVGLTRKRTYDLIETSGTRAKRAGLGSAYLPPGWPRSSRPGAIRPSPPPSPEVPCCGAEAHEHHPLRPCTAQGSRERAQVAVGAHVRIPSAHTRAEPHLLTTN